MGLFQIAQVGYVPLDQVGYVPLDQAGRGRALVGCPP